MSTVTSFDITTVRSWNNPQHDTFTTVNFHHPYVAPPRIPHGLRQLEIDNRANIRVLTPIENIQRDSAVYHVSSWDNTKLYSGIVDSLTLAAANLDIMCSEHRRDSNSRSEVRINFEHPFITPPKVLVFLNAFNLDRSSTWRPGNTATNIDERGFTLNGPTPSFTVPKSGGLRTPRTASTFLVPRLALRTSVHETYAKQEHIAWF